MAPTVSNAAMKLFMGFLPWKNTGLGLLSTLRAGNPGAYAAGSHEGQRGREIAENSDSRPITVAALGRRGTGEQAEYSHERLLDDALDNSDGLHARFLCNEKPSAAQDLAPAAVVH